MNFEFKKEYGKYFGIYCITNNINGKRYIGQTIRAFEIRHYEHEYRSGLDQKYNKYGKSKLYNAMRKYGKENFSFDILSFCSDLNQIDDMERYYILKFNSIKGGMNLDSGGCSQHVRSLQTRLKIKKGNTGKKLSQETKDKIGNAHRGRKNAFWYGRKHTNDAKKKISDAKQNISQEIRHNLSIALMGHKHSDETKLKLSKSHIDKGLIPIYMFNNDEVLEYFDSMKAAGQWIKNNNITQCPRPQSMVSQCCLGKIRTAYGYRWMVATNNLTS